jgi:metal-responsive CopG/Arc/MetJ family transcriptional regulator
MTKTRTAEGRTRVIATLDDELVARVDSLAKIEGQSRSSMVEWILANFICRAERDLIRKHERHVLELKRSAAEHMYGKNSEQAEKLLQEYLREFETPDREDEEREIRESMR